MNNLQAFKIAIVIAVLMSALLLVYATHLSRANFNELEVLKRTETDLQNQWRRLLLEEGALASLARVENMASERMGMHVPDTSRIKVVSP